MKTISKLHMEEEALTQQERNGGYDWHEAGDMRLLADIRAYKSKSLLARIIDWLRGK